VEAGLTLRFHARLVVCGVMGFVVTDCDDPCAVRIVNRRTHARRVSTVTRLETRAKGKAQTNREERHTFRYRNL
jgi:hypothetical protein